MTSGGPPPAPTSTTAVPPPAADEMGPPRAGPAETDKKEEEPMPLDVIDRLNVQARTRAARSSYPPDHPFHRPIQMVKDGATVFKHRWWPLLYFFWGLCVWGLLTAPSLSFLAGAFLVSYIYIDIYGAVLHIVLDNPDFLSIPFLWEPCLEFQWHHIIPHEICAKEYHHVAGDANSIVMIEFAALVAWFGGLDDPRVRAVGCCCVFHAYLGQWAHRQAHFVKHSRDPIADKLQQWGLIVGPKLHNSHHRTFDTGFPILSGRSDPLINFLFKAVPNKWVWLFVFVAMSLFGIIGLTTGYIAAYEAVFGPAIAISA